MVEDQVKQYLTPDDLRWELAFGVGTILGLTLIATST